MGPRTYTVAETAALFGVSRDSIYKKIRAGELTGIRFGRRTVIPRREVDQLLGDTGDDQAPAAAS